MIKKEQFSIEAFGQDIRVVGDFSPGRPQALNEPEELPEFTVTELWHDRTKANLDEIPDDFLTDIEIRFLDGDFCDDDQER